MRNLFWLACVTEHTNPRHTNLILRVCPVTQASFGGFSLQFYGSDQQATNNSAAAFSKNKLSDNSTL